MEAGGGAQVFLDAEKLIVLGDAVGAAGGAGFDLAGGRSHGEIGDESVFGLAGSMGNDGIVAGFTRELDGVNSFGYGSDLIQLDENGLADAPLAAAGRAPRAAA